MQVNSNFQCLRLKRQRPDRQQGKESGINQQCHFLELGLLLGRPLRSVDVSRVGVAQGGSSAAEVGVGGVEKTKDAMQIESLWLFKGAY